MIETIDFDNSVYPAFQAKGNAAQFALPFAKHVCIGKGVDVGCNRLEWAFPGAYPVDPAINEWHALHFPPEYTSGNDYVFSSHCLEHLSDWVPVLEYWISSLKSQGTLFLYLPDYSQKYWRPWNNRKHKNIFTPQIIYDYLLSNNDLNPTKIFVSETDLNNSFIAIAEKN